jgi:hypothetical protein
MGKGGNMSLAKGRLALMVAVAVAVLAITSVPAPLVAQSLGMRVDIPFEFHVGDKTLPAGTYIVQRQGDAIKLSDSNGNSAHVLSNAVKNPSAKTTNELVFSRYGEDCFLSEVRWFGYSDARGVIKSSNEIALTKAFTGNSVLSAGLGK